MGGDAGDSRKKEVREVTLAAWELLKGLAPIVVVGLAGLLWQHEKELAEIRVTRFSDQDAHALERAVTQSLEGIRLELERARLTIPTLEARLQKIEARIERIQE